MMTSYRNCLKKEYSCTHTMTHVTGRHWILLHFADYFPRLGLQMWKQLASPTFHLGTHQFCTCFAPTHNCYGTRRTTHKSAVSTLTLLNHWCSKGMVHLRIFPRDPWTGSCHTCRSGSASTVSLLPAHLVRLQKIACERLFLQSWLLWGAAMTVMGFLPA